MNHTPIPWDVQNKGVLGERSARHEIVAGVNRDGSRNLPTICKMPDLSERSYANAAFIVKAVNCHDALLKACKLCEAVLTEHEQYDGFNDDDCSPSREHEAVEAARAAIAKAEEKK